MFKKRTLLRAGAVTAVFTAAATTAAVSAQGAPAAQNSAFALSAAGLVTIKPVPYSDSRGGDQKKSLAEFATPDKSVKADVLNANANSVRSASSVSELAVKISDPRLSQVTINASAVRAQCSSAVGTASLVNATISGRHVPVSPPPNTEIQLPGAGSAVLNKQTRQADGSIIVTAVRLEIKGMQDLDVASVKCAPGTGTPPGTPPPSVTPPSHDHPQPPAPAPRPSPVKGHLPVTG